MSGPLGFPVVGNSTGYLFGATPQLNAFVMPGGMAVAGNDIFFMIVAGWVAFTGFPPL